MTVELHQFELLSFTNQPAPSPYEDYAIIDGVKRPIGVGVIAARGLRAAGEMLVELPRPHRTKIFTDAPPAGGQWVSNGDRPGSTWVA